MSSKTFALSIFIVWPIAIFLIGLVLYDCATPSEIRPIDLVMPKVIAIATIGNAILFVPRLNRLGWNRNYAWLSIVPVVNLIFAIYLACAEPK